MEIGANLLSRRHLRTRMSSWLKDHSFAEKSVAWLLDSEEVVDFEEFEGGVSVALGVADWGVS